MKELIKLLLLLTITLSLPSCWTKKCENPDEEHRSWTMVPEGRTEAMIFRRPSGVLDTCRVYQPTYGKSQPKGSTSSCTGAHFSCQLNYEFKYHGALGTYSIYWAVERNNSGSHSYNILTDHSYDTQTEINGDTMTSNFKLNGGNWKIKNIKILKNKGIQSMNVNDTIYERID